MGRTDNGIEVVSTLVGRRAVYYPLHVTADTPAGRLPSGINDPGFATKPQLAAGLVGRAIAARIPFAAVVADSFYGPSQTDILIGAPNAANLPYVLALQPSGVFCPAFLAVGPNVHPQGNTRESCVP